MTLLETERLIRKMSELLQQGGHPDIAPKFAGDYTAACHAANLRLQQCEAMINAGDRHQAIQLAETAPNLLDLITVLEFRSADDWRSFCQQNALPTAERIDARSVQALNDCYAQGITTDHPLYAAYRKAVLNRNDDESLKALQSIVRLNPTDANAASEHARLDAKVLTARIEHLGGMLAGGDTRVIVGAIEAIEAFGFRTPPSGEVWARAAVVRCDYLIEEVAGLKDASRWNEGLSKVEFVRHLQNDLKLELSAPSLKRLEELESWAKQEQAKDRKNREFGTLLAELQYRVQQSEAKDTSARYVKLPELRDDFEALNKVWRSLADFTRPIPDESTSAFRKRAGLLEGEIARRTAIRRRTIFLTSAAVLVVGAVTAWFILGQTRAKDFTLQLQAAVSQRQVHSAERLSDHLRTNEKRLLSMGNVTDALATSDAFVAGERALLANFESAIGKLPTKLGGDPDPATINAIANQLAQTHTTLNAIAPDLKAENEPRVVAFEKQWQQFLSESGLAVNKLFDSWISDAEIQCSKLDYRTPVEKAAAQISRLSEVIHKINDAETGFTNHVPLRKEILQRAAAASAKFTAYQRELKKLEEGMAELKKAHGLGDFSSQINLIASSEFSSAPAASAASLIQSLGISEEATLRMLLGATNASTWAFINRGKPANLIPEIAMPAERIFFQRLVEDPAVNASHHSYRLWLDKENTKNTEWITAGPLETSQGWNQVKAWTPSTNAASAIFENREYGYFDGQWKLTPTQPIYRLEHVALLKDASAFASVGLGQMWSGGSSFTKPGLEMLDVIKSSGDGSPVFRAYLFSSLVELMGFQPDAWGLSFCPSANADALAIQSIVGGKIASGDWFVPSKAQAWNDKLAQFFAARKAVSYIKEAGSNRLLAQTAAKDGLRYVGFIDLDGKAVIVESPPPPEIWGYEKSTKQPDLLSNSTMPLSPLFALPVTRSNYLSKAGINMGALASASVLPRLFRSPVQQ